MSYFSDLEKDCLKMANNKTRNSSIEIILGLNFFVNVDFKNNLFNLAMLGVCCCGDFFGSWVYRAYSSCGV